MLYFGAYALKEGKRPVSETDTQITMGSMNRNQWVQAIETF
jgi:hypothetical protein